MVHQHTKVALKLNSLRDERSVQAQGEIHSLRSPTGMIPRRRPRPAAHFNTRLPSPRAVRIERSARL